jgi:hypothetical protein
MTSRLEETVKGGEYHIPDVVTKLMQQDANRPAACWPFIAERYVWGEIVFQSLLNVGRGLVPSTRDDCVAVFERATGRIRNTLNNSGDRVDGPHTLDVELGHRHECAVLVRINERIEDPQLIPLQVPFDGIWWAVPSLVRLERFQEFQNVKRQEVVRDHLSLPRHELRGLVVDRELKPSLVNNLGSARMLEGDCIDEVVEGRAEVYQTVADQRGEFVGRRDGSVQDNPIGPVGGGVIRHWIVLTDKTIRLHIEKPADTVVDLLKMFVRPTELAPLGHCLGLDR